MKIVYRFFEITSLIGIGICLWWMGTQQTFHSMLIGVFGSLFLFQIIMIIHDLKGMDK